MTSNFPAFKVNYIPINLAYNRLNRMGIGNGPFMPYNGWGVYGL